MLLPPQSRHVGRVERSHALRPKSWRASLKRGCAQFTAKKKQCRLVHIHHSLTPLALALLPKPNMSLPPVMIV